MFAVIQFFARVVFTLVGLVVIFILCHKWMTAVVRESSKHWTEIARAAFPRRTLNRKEKWKHLLHIVSFIIPAIALCGVRAAAKEAVVFLGKRVQARR